MSLLHQNTLLLFLLLLISCETAPPSKEAPATDNPEIARLYEEDQADRRNGNIDWSVVGARDEQRRRRMLELIETGQVRTGQDHHRAAMIFQHGGDTTAYNRAIELMRTAIELDSTVNPWLLAAAIDRNLMQRGQPQIYGTQYTREGDDAPWRLYDIDTTVISPEERRRYRVPSLAAQRERERRMNLRKLDDYYAEGATVAEVIALIDGQDPERAAYDLSEQAVNGFGYLLIGQGKLTDARTILAHNVDRFPEAFNTHDSYGEILLLLGDTTAAVAAYERSVELNPANEGGRRVLATLRGTAPPEQ